ncbi:MAG: hypothetical protein LKJ80_01975 [Oscillibacter sp.]|jgi:hypothetical protein|nr:hypothetical protein [Oscillibacter sp.]
MTIHEKTLSLAKSISGALAAEEELLEALCTADERAWAERLTADADPAAAEGALVCAAAFSAAADLLSARGSSDGFSSFTAGSVSVTAAAKSELAASARALRASAERLMAPFASADDFAFRGVRA